MKNPQYKIGDYVEFKCWNGKFDLRTTADVMKKGFITGINKGSRSDTWIATRSGKQILIMKSEIIRKLPILRDKNGRFSKNKPFSSSKIHWKSEIEAQPSWKKYEKELEKDCSCFNCDKCAEQMRAYYEKTEEKKPSERISALYYEDKRNWKHNELSRTCSAILDYLDEQFEKNK